MLGDYRAAQSCVLYAPVLGNVLNGDVFGQAVLIGQSLGLSLASLAT